MTRSIALLALAGALALGCTEPAAETAPQAEAETAPEADPDPAPEVDPDPAPEPEPDPEPAAEAEAEPEGPSELPLAELAAVPASAPAWIEFTAQLCSGGEPKGCWLLGAVHARGLLGEVDRPRAHALFALACRGERGYGCSELAGFVDPAEAHEHLTRGCAADRADACLALSASLESTDARAATTARMRACSLGRGLVCVPVPTPFPHDASPAPAGAPTEESRVPAGADPTIRAIAQRCDRGMAAMCAWLAPQYAYGNDYGLPEDRAHGLELARRSCNEEAAAGCFHLGALLIGDARGPQDAASAGSALGRACTVGIGDACAASARVSDRMPDMAPLADMMRFEACVDGHEESCNPG